MEAFPMIHAEEVAWDFVCNKPLPHITFILKYFMSDANPFVSNSKELREYKNRIQEKIENQCKACGMGVLFKCGRLTGLEMPAFRKRNERTKETKSEQDIVIREADLILVKTDICVGTKDELYPYCADTDDTPTGYLRIVANDRATGDEGLYLSREEASKLFNTTNIDWAGEVLINNPEHSDIHIGFHYPNCPAMQNEWMEHERLVQWPPRAVFDDIVKSGCHVVTALHHKDSMPDLVWKLSFAEAENKLAESLNTVQRQCYMVLETLVLHELSPPYLLTPNCLRNHFFWCLEKLPEDTWMDELHGLGIAFQYVTNQLLYALINKNLPHYFVPTLNLIDDISEDFLDELTAKVNDLHSNPIKYLLRFDSKYYFSHTSVSKTMKVLLNPVLQDCLSYHNSISRCHEAQWKAGYNMCMTFIQEGNFAAAQASCRMIANSDESLGSICIPSVLMEKCISKLNNNKEVIKGLEFIENNFPDVTDTLYERMACVYTSLYCSAQDFSEKEHYKKRADTLFQSSLDVLGVDITLSVYYSVYLQLCDRTHDSIALLNKSIYRQHWHQRETLTRVLLDKKCYDENIQKQFDHLHEVSPLLQAFYQLSKCYIRINEQDKTKELLPDFRAVVASQNNSFGYSLFGFILLALSELDAAKKAFQKAAQLRED